MAASLAEDIEHTWIGRRGILDNSNFSKYMNTLYFSLQIFSTVGYGDIEISLTSEYILVCVGMLVGAICYSFLTGLAISWIT